MKFGAICRQVFTGPDNETIAWGRVLGAIVFALFVVLLPTALVILLALKRLAIGDVTGLLESLALYLPGACLAAWSFVTGTGMFEPKRRDQAQ